MERSVITEQEIQNMLNTAFGFEEKGLLAKKLISYIRKIGRDNRIREGKIYQLMDIGESDFDLILSNAPQGVIEDCWREAWKNNTGGDESPLETFLRDIVVEGYEVVELEIEDRIYTD